MHQAASVAHRPTDDAGQGLVAETNAQHGNARHQSAEDIHRGACLFGATGPWRDEIYRLSDIFRGRILDVTNGMYIIELTGTGEKLDAFIAALDKKSILEVVRSGTLGIGRGEKSLKL